jgi:hypothetical protein
MMTHTFKRYNVLLVQRNAEDSAEFRLPARVREVLGTPGMGPAQVNTPCIFLPIRTDPT